MPFTPRTIMAVLVLLGISASVHAGTKFDLADPPEGTFSEQWYAVQLSGTKCGHMHSTLKRKGNIIIATEDMDIAIQRAKIRIPMSISKITRETLAGKPLSIKSVTKMSVVAITHDVTIDGDKVTVTTRQFGQPQTTTYRIPQTFSLTWGALLEQEKHGRKPGTAYTTNTYDPTLSAGKVIPADVVIGERKMVDLFGRKIEAIETDAKTKFLGTTLVTKAYLADDGLPIKLSVPLTGTGMTIEMIECPKAFALREGTAPEMFLSSLIHVDRKVDRETLRSARYKLSLANDDGTRDFPSLPETDMQKVESTADGQAVLRIVRTNHAALAKVSAAKPRKEDAEYLRSSVFLNHQDPEVRKLAVEARGNAKRPYALADRLRKFVSAKIISKDLNIGFATAGEVARSREGDCSEHAVLLAALGRASGLPARVVSGIIYVDQFAARRQIFGFHMWTQFKIGDKWIDFDAAQNQTDCDPTHIALAVSPLNDEGLADVSLSLLGLIGRLKVDILDTQPPGKPK